MSKGRGYPTNDQLLEVLQIYARQHGNRVHSEPVVSRWLSRNGYGFSGWIYRSRFGSMAQAAALLGARHLDVATRNRVRAQMHDFVAWRGHRLEGNTA